MGFYILKTLCVIYVALSVNSCVVSHQLETPDNATVLLRTDIIPDEILDFCPIKCGQGNVNQQSDFGLILNTGNMCCIPCDCTSSCFAAGTCCIDIQTEHTHDGPESSPDEHEETCVRTAVGDNQAKATIIDIDSYMLIQLCSSRVNPNIGYDVISKCLNPDRNVFDEMVPVHSNFTDRNYRNIYCAMCNEDSSSILPWRSHLTCNNYTKTTRLFSRSSESNTNETLLQVIRDTEGCILQWRPENDKARICIDHDDVISRCNKPKFFSSALENLCRQTYSPVKGVFGVYKNVFCLRCNEGDGTVEFTCVERSVTYVQPRLFSALLGPEAYLVQHDNQVKRALKCKKGMTYDNKLERCILKSCPISQAKVGDSCQPILQKVRGVSFDYRFKLFYQMDGFILPPQDLLFAELRHLVVYKSGYICGKRLLGVESEGEQVIVRIQLTRKHGDKNMYIDIYEDFLAVQKQVEEMNKLAAEGTIKYTVKMDNSPFLPVLGNYVSLGVFSDIEYPPDQCYTAIAISNMQFCNTVLVKDYDLLEDGVVLVDGYIPFSPGEYIPTYASELDTSKRYMYICYDMYVSRGTDSSYLGATNVTNIASTTDLVKPFSVLTSFLFATLGLL